MKKVKKRYRLTYYKENEKQPYIYEIKEKNFYKAEIESLQKLVEVKKLDLRKKDKITLTNNKTGVVYHAEWNKLSPIIDKKISFILKNLFINRIKIEES
ncbi:hypothetical protein [Bacillus bombysepticus]|uniref:hypothetical protein n=1 Tax=Bacillus bombysepticus TaxID=658666 RepID=UPI00301A5258